VTTGTWSGSSSSRANYSWSGSGTSTTTYGSGSDATTWAISRTEGGETHANDHYNASYSLDGSGNWHVVSGTGGGGFSGSASASYSGNGTYVQYLYSGRIAGTNSASGRDEAGYNFSFSATLGSDNTWTYTGTGTTTTSGEQHRGYSGSGTCPTG
jgi:hypothetical protein